MWIYRWSVGIACVVGFAWHVDIARWICILCLVGVWFQFGSAPMGQGVANVAAFVGHCVVVGVVGLLAQMLVIAFDVARLTQHMHGTRVGCSLGCLRVRDDLPTNAHDWVVDAIVGVLVAPTMPPLLCHRGFHCRCGNVTIVVPLRLLGPMNCCPGLRLRPGCHG